MTGRAGEGGRAPASAQASAESPQGGTGPRCPLEVARDPAGPASVLGYGERSPGTQPVAAAPAPAPAPAGGAAGDARAAGETRGGRAASKVQSAGCKGLGRRAGSRGASPSREQGWPPVGPWRVEISQLWGVASRPHKPPARGMCLRGRRRRPNARPSCSWGAGGDASLRQGPGFTAGPRTVWAPRCLS